MKAVHKFLIGAAGLAVAAGGFAAPAAAQYYPPYGGYGQGGGVGNVIVGAILDSILRGGYQGGYGSYGNQYGYGYNNERVAIDQCARAAQQRLNRSSYGGSYGGYNNAAYRIAQIERVERRSYGFKVWGIATAGGYQGNYGAYGGGYGGYGNQYGYAGGPDYRFDCEVDYRGRIRDVDLDRLNNRYGGYRY